MPRILVVDDHPLIRKGIINVLADEFPQSNFLEASNAAETIASVWAQHFDLVLLDLSLQGRSGLELLKEIKAARPRLPVLILSMHPEVHFATRALRAGAAGYVSKDTLSAQLIQAVRRAMSGGKVISPETAERLASELGMDTSKPLHERLSDREFDSMLRLASGQSVSEIAAELNLSVKTVSTYRTRVMLKMGKQSNAELTQYAIRNNLME
jgi:DNA-binding NarL/FixJ family response regulator